MNRQHYLAYKHALNTATWRDIRALRGLQRKRERDYWKRNKAQVARWEKQHAYVNQLLAQFERLCAAAGR